MDDIQFVREAFGDLVGRASPEREGRVAAAFKSVPREAYLGRGPWRIFSPPANYTTTATDDPRELYRDVVVGLIPEKLINNGQPTLHALCLGILNPCPEHTVVHVGAGSGYYTAIIAHLVCNGEVHAYEVEPDLADAASRNLAHLANVQLHAFSAAEGALPSCDVIYASAGVTSPPDTWLNALRPGGRLMCPLTAEDLFGAMVLITRVTPEQFSARILMPVAFIPCVGARDSAGSSALSNALKQENWQAVRSLRRGSVPDESCWLATPNCWFSTMPPAE